MNKTLLTAALAATLSTSAFAGETPAPEYGAPSLNVSGEVRTFVEMSSVDTDPEVKSTDTKVVASWNAPVANGLSTFGEFGANYDASQSGNLTTRFAYVGVKGDFGALSIGRQISIMEGYVDQADRFKNGGNDGVQKMGFYQDNAVKFVKEIGELEVAAQVTMVEDANDETFDTYQVGAKYNGLGVAYGKDNTNDTTYMGAGYTMKLTDTVSLAGSISEKETATTTTRGYEVLATTKLSDANTLKVGYQDTDVAGDDGTVTGGFEHSFGKSGLTAFATVDHFVETGDNTLYTGLSFVF